MMRVKRGEKFRATPNLLIPFIDVRMFSTQLQNNDVEIMHVVIIHLKL